MSTFEFSGCRIDEWDRLTPITATDLTIRVAGTLSGTSTARTIIFAQPKFSCDAYVQGRSFVAWLPRPGHYAICYRVLNNFVRLIQESEIADSCEINLFYDPPTLTIQVSGLPKKLQQGGMVYRRSSNGYSGCHVASFSKFTLNFEWEPDLFLDKSEVLGLVAGAKEYQFPFQTKPGTVLQLDFAQAEEVPFPPPNLPEWPKA